MNLLNSTETSKALGMTKQAFSKGVKSGRFTPARRDHLGRPLFDLAHVKKEYADTRELAALQDRASWLPPSMRGGRPRKDSKDGKDRAAFMARVLKSRAKVMEAQLKMAKLRLAKMEERYIDKDVAQKQGRDLYAVLCGVLSEWPALFAPKILALKRRGGDEHDIRHLLEEGANDLIISMLDAAKKAFGGD